MLGAVCTQPATWHAQASRGGRNLSARGPGQGTAYVTRVEQCTLPWASLRPRARLREEECSSSDSSCRGMDPSFHPGPPGWQPSQTDKVATVQLREPDSGVASPPGELSCTGTGVDRLKIATNSSSPPKAISSTPPARGPMPPAKLVRPASADAQCRTHSVCELLVA